VADTGKSRPAPAAETPAAEGHSEPFVSRWSRLKREARERPAEKPPVVPGPADPKAPAPELPPPETLTFDSDYRQFFHPKVGEDVRRTALKKLFSDPRFNVMDGLDVYIDDYSKTEAIPAAMLAGLKQAQNILQWAREDTEERERRAAAAEKSSSGVPEQASLESSEARADAAIGPEMEMKAMEPAPAGTSDAGASTCS